MKLRTAVEKDCQLLFRWANDPKVRANSFDLKGISWEEHQKWFKKKMDKETCRMFILEKDANPIGEIRFDKEGENWVISYSIEDKYRGMGLGKEIVKKGIEKVSKPILAWVKMENIASRKTFESLGFSIQEKKENSILYILA